MLKQKIIINLIFIFSLFLCFLTIKPIYASDSVRMKNRFKIEPFFVYTTVNNNTVVAESSGVFNTDIHMGTSGTAIGLIIGYKKNTWLDLDFMFTSKTSTSEDNLTFDDSVDGFFSYNYGLITAKIIAFSKDNLFFGLGKKGLFVGKSSTTYVKLGGGCGFYNPITFDVQYDNNHLVIDYNDTIGFHFTLDFETISNSGRWSFTVGFILSTVFYQVDKAVLNNSEISKSSLDPTLQEFSAGNADMFVTIGFHF